MCVREIFVKISMHHSQVAFNQTWISALAFTFRIEKKQIDMTSGLTKTECTLWHLSAYPFEFTGNSFHSVNCPPSIPITGVSGFAFHLIGNITLPCNRAFYFIASRKQSYYKVNFIHLDLHLNTISRLNMLSNFSMAHDWLPRYLMVNFKKQELFFSIINFLNLNGIIMKWSDCNDIGLFDLYSCLFPLQRKS